MIVTLEWGVDTTELIRGYNSSEYFTCNLLPIQTVVAPGGSPVTNTVTDSIITTTAGSIVDNEYQININVSLNTTFTPTVINSSPEIAVVSGNYLRWVSDGTGTLSITDPSGTGIELPYTVSRQSSISSTWLGWVNSTTVLSNHVFNAIHSMTAGKTSALTNWEVSGESSSAATNNTQSFLTYSNNDITSPAVTRNPNLFIGTLDIPWSTIMTSQAGVVESGCEFPVQLIHPYIAISSHVGYSVGDKFVWLDTSNSYQTRSVVQVQQLFGIYGLHFIYLLDSPVTTITPVKFLPGNYRSYLPSFGQSFSIDFPVLTHSHGGPLYQVIGQYGYVDILNINVSSAYMTATGLQSWNSGSVTTYPPASSTSGMSDLTTWSWITYGGDSNGPVFIPIDQAGGTNYQAVLPTNLNFTTGAAFYADSITIIDGYMNQLYAGAATSKINLTYFNSY